MSKLQWSLVVWGIWLAAFLIIELLGGFHKAPWFTLSRTTWTIENRWAWFSFVILFGLAVLMVHLFVGGPVKLAGAAARSLLGK